MSKWTTKTIAETDSPANVALGGLHSELLDLANPLEPLGITHELMTRGRDVVLEADLSRADAPGAGDEVDLTHSD